MTDIMTETPEEKAALEAIQNEQEFQLADDPQPEVKAEPEPTPVKEEPKAEPKAEPEPKKPVRLVPHEALHEERTKRQALEREIAELRKPREQPRTEPTGDMPDEHTDPLGTIAWLKAQISKDRQERENAQREHQQIAELGQRVKARVDAYAAEHPEYTDQLQFLRQSRFKELRVLGFDEQSAMASVTREEMQIGQMAVDRDMDPGDIIARLSMERGWKPKEEPKPEPKPNAAEKTIERLAKGQKAAISPSVGGGEGAAAEMTLEQLASLGGDAFDKAFAKHARRLLGG